MWVTASNVTLIARWTMNSYCILYELDGGTNSVSNPNTYTSETETITLIDPTKIGYKFLGWTTSSITTPTKNLKIEKNSIGDKSFTANWEANKYVITYDVNGGNELSSNTQEVTFDSQYELVVPTRVGYEFAGWYTSDNQLYKNGMWVTASNVLLVGNWIPNTNTKYTVYHYQENINDDEFTLFDIDNFEGTSDSSVTPDVKIYEGFNSPEYQNVIIKADGTLLVKYYYSRKIYSVTFITNGGSSVERLEQKYESLYDSNISSTKDNRTFGGWYTNETLSIEYTDFKIGLSNITLYAKWEEEVLPFELTYIKSNDSITLSGTTYAGSNLILPSHIGGLPVTTIVSYGFKDLNLVTNVEVPDTVTSIGAGAFEGMSSLESIILPFVGARDGANGYESVFGYIFGYSSKGSYYNSTSAYVWYVGNSKCSYVSGTISTDYVNALPGSESTAYSISGGTWQYSNFTQTYKLTGYYYYIPESLRNVTITVDTTIPTAAFNGCKNIASISIPNNTISIGESAFQNCSILKRINSETDGLFNIPSGVEEINDYTFYGCSLVEEVTLSNNITSIGNYTFTNCTIMTKFNSENMYELIVPKSCESIGKYTFKGMGLITNVEVPDTVTSIGAGAFEGMSSLESIILPFVGARDGANGYESVFGYIFGYSSKGSYYNSTSAYVWYVGNSKCSYVSGTISTDYVNALPGSESTAYSISGGTWQYSNFTQTYKLTGYYYYIPESLRNVTITVDTTIPTAAFNGCKMLNNIHLVNCIDSIGDYAFQNCTAIVDYLIIPTRSGVWDGVLVATKYHGGNGSINNPYQIFSPKEFVYFLNQIRNGENYENTYFTLSSNIYLGGYTINSTAVTEETAFKGFLDGNGYIISDFDVKCEDNVFNGLFGYVDGSIKNIGFATSMNINTTLSSDVYVGMIIGKLNGSIENSYVSGYLSSNSSRNSFIGGLVGFNNGMIIDSYSNVDVSSTSTNLKCYSGGLVGSNNGLIKGSFAYGNVSSKGYVEAYSYSSGLIAFEGSNSSILNCYRYNGQIYIKYECESSPFNNVGTSASLEEIINYCKSNWNNDVWSYSKNLPSFKR